MTKRTQELLEVISSVDTTVYEVLTPTNLEAARAEFFAYPELQAPTFRYEKLNGVLVDENLEVLLGVQAEIFPIRAVSDDVVLDTELATFDKVERQLLQMLWWDVYHKNSFLRAVLDYQAARKREREVSTCCALSREKLQRLANQTSWVKKRFYLLDEDVYDKPDEVTYRAILGRQLNQIDQIVRKVIDETSELTSGALFELLDADLQTFELSGASLQELNYGEKADYEIVGKVSSMLKVVCELDYLLHDIELPEESCEGVDCQVLPEVVQKFANLVCDRMERFLRYLPSEQEEFTARDMYDVLQKILTKELAGETGFRVELVSDRTSLSVDQLARVIQVPKNRAKGNYTPTQMRAMLGHELGTHVMRGVPFENSPVKMLSTGLPHYEEFEEGLANCVEQVIKGEIGPTGEDHYRNIGLAYFDEKDFREVFEIGWRMLYLKDWKLGHDAKKCAERWQKCQNLAFAQAMRCFRGTGELVNFKDLIYYRGTQRAWRYIGEHIDDEPDELWRNLFGMGKIDPTREDHMRLVREVMMV